MDELLASFFDELEKIGANVLMKALSPAKKKLMERMTGFAHGASIPQAAGARRLRGALTGAGSPQLMTEMHGMGHLLSAGERQAKQQAKQHFEGVLARQGKIYKGAPGLEQQIGAIGGHPGQITRTPAVMVPPARKSYVPGQPVQVRPGRVGTTPGTVAASPHAKLNRYVSREHMPTAVAPVNPYGRTIMAPEPTLMPAGA